MKKAQFIITLLLITILCCSCGVTQDEYETIVWERDFLEENFETMIELREYEIIVEKDYEAINAIFDVLELAGGDVAESRQEFEELYQSVNAALQVEIKAYELSLDTGYSVDLEESLSKLKDIMNNWKTATDSVYKMIK